MEQCVRFGKKGFPIRNLIASPSGQYVVCIYGEGRTAYSSKTEESRLFHRKGSAFVEAGKLPCASVHTLVLDDGKCIVIVNDYQKIECIRYTPHSTGIVEEARWMELSGLSLSDVEVVLLASGYEALLGVVDRDDGQGWSEPVYTSVWHRVDLRSGRCVQESSQMIGTTHLLRAPGKPWLSPHHGGDANVLTQRIQRLPFATEWPLRVGPHLLVTTSRVIDVLTGATILGEEPARNQRHRVFYDLSSNERYAVAADKEETFELWDVQSRKTVELSSFPIKGVRTAIFLAEEEVVLGTADGEGIVLPMPR